MTPEACEIVAKSNGGRPRKAICEKCGGPRKTPYKTVKGIIYMRCGICEAETKRTWYHENISSHKPRCIARKARASQTKYQDGPLHRNNTPTPRAPKLPKPIWQPSWAAQSSPEIVKAVCDYRRAIRSIRSAPHLSETKAAAVQKMQEADVVSMQRVELSAV